jgi:hypothetical protein
MKNTNTGGGSQVLRCHGCGAVHPDRRAPTGPNERTVCADCEARTEVDPGFDLLIGLAVLTDVPLYVAQARGAAPEVH